MARTRLAVLLATSLADWTKWRLATGLDVFEDAMRHVLHSAEVCLAITVAAERTCYKGVIQSGIRLGYLQEIFGKGRGLI